MDICGAFGNYFEYLNKSISWNLPRELVSDLLENTMFPKTEIKKLLKFPKGIKSKNISATSGK